MKTNKVASCWIDDDLKMTFEQISKYELKLKIINIGEADKLKKFIPIIC